MLISIALLAMYPSHDYAASPERAAQQIVGVAHGTAKVRRANVSGPYAAVLLFDGILEGHELGLPILVERFSFGWQPVDVLDDACRLAARHLDPNVEKTLMRGMPTPRAAPRAICGDESILDSGPHRDVEAVRRKVMGPLVPRVSVAGDWAIGEWYGAGGGMALFRRTGDAWRLVQGGGGALGVEIVRRKGVPPSAWCALHVVDAPCADRVHRKRRTLRRLKEGSSASR